MSNQFLQNRITQYCIKQWCVLWIIFFSMVPVATFALQPTVTRVQTQQFPNYTRLIFSVNAMNKFHVFTLSGPNRVVVDFEDGLLRADLKALSLAGSILTDVRTGHPKGNTFRIVFDATMPVHVSLKLDRGAQESQLVVDVFPKQKMTAVVSPSPKKLVAVQTIAVNKVASKPKVVVENYNLPVKPAKPTAIVSQQVKKVVQVQQRKKPVAQLTADIKPHTIVVVIDPGHGGKDPGTKGIHGVEEKEVVLNIALRLATMINREPNMRAELTRDGDYFVTLRDRLKLAHKDKADLFVAIHADSYSREQFSGVSVYALSRHGATSEAAHWLAKQENYSELGGVDLGELSDKSYVLRSVLIDLAQTATITDSVRLGNNVIGALGKVAKLHKSWVEQAPFVVLKSPDIPSILVETGFLSNPVEEERLSDPVYRDKLAQALLSGIRHYLISHPIVGA